MRDLFKEAIEQTAAAGILPYPHNFMTFDDFISLKETLWRVNEACKCHDPTIRFLDHDINRVTKSEIENMRQKKLLIFKKSKTGEIQYHRISIERILYIKILLKKLQMPYGKIHEIIFFENQMWTQILKSGATTKPRFTTRSALGVLRKSTRYVLEQYEKELRRLDSGAVNSNLRDKIEKQIQESKDLLNYLNRKRWEDLRRDEALIIAEKAVGAFVEALLRIWFVFYVERDMVLQGYSPLISFSSAETGTDNRYFSFGEINWQETLKYIKWGNRYFSFFRTPDFEIEIKKDETIDIHIFHPEKVKADTMRQINKIYTLFLKRLGVGRARWGAKRGSKKYYEGRNKFLREQADALRQTTKSWDALSQNLGKALLEKGYNLPATETMRKIAQKGKKRLQ